LPVQLSEIFLRSEISIKLWIFKNSTLTYFKKTKYALRRTYWIFFIRKYEIDNTKTGIFIEGHNRSALEAIFAHFSYWFYSDSFGLGVTGGAPLAAAISWCVKYSSSFIPYTKEKLPDYQLFKDRCVAQIMLLHFMQRCKLLFIISCDL
jgi:hypothetical protein